MYSSMPASISLPSGTRAVSEIVNGTYIPNYLIGQTYAAHRYAEEEARQQEYILYREYYDGIHDTKLTERVRKFLGVSNDKHFNINLCAIVVDALAERLKVTGFSAGDDEAQSKLFWQWWRDNRMDSQQGILHTAAVRDGDVYALVEWDNEEMRPSFSFELACASAEGVKVHYSPEKRNKIASASKRWKIGDGGETKARRMNLYFPERVEKYISTDSNYEGNWRPYEDEDGSGEIAQGVLGPCGWQWWTDTGRQGGKPLGVPVVHFKNKDQGYNNGQSELSNIIPVQDGLNKAAADLIAAADTSAFAVWVGIGDKFTGLSIYPGALVAIENPEASLSKAEGSDLTGLINIKNEWEIDAARVSRTPISYFQANGTNPAEGTLQQQESGLVAKVEKCQTDFGNSYEDMMKIARRLHNAFGSGKLDETVRIETGWKQAQSRNEREHVETIAVKVERLGVPKEKGWEELGYNAEEIREFKRIDARRQAAVTLMQTRERVAQMATNALPPGAMPAAQPTPPTPPPTEEVKDAKAIPAKQ